MTAATAPGAARGRACGCLGAYFHILLTRIAKAVTGYEAKLARAAP